jgi:hypothetical protein
MEYSKPHIYQILLDSVLAYWSPILQDRAIFLAEHLAALVLWK